MGATPFKTVSWGNEPLATTKLQAMTNNDQWLFENMPKVYYNAHGIKRTNGVKILTGFCRIPATNAIGNSTSVNFGSYFTAGCKPVVITSVNSYPQGRFHIWTRGMGTLFPDHRGFEVRLNADEVDPKNNKIRFSVWIPYICIGY